MVRLEPFPRALERPYTALAIAFLVWKTGLYLIAFLAPGPGYDTSTSLSYGGRSFWMPWIAPWVVESNDVPRAWNALRDFAHNLVRWDAIHFDAVARRGYLFEQDWAWGWGHTQSISAITKVLRLWFQREGASSPWMEMNVAVALAHACHFASVMVLFMLTRVTFGQGPGDWLPFVTAALHIISPAGIFLSAPYAESLFSLLAFSGILFYLKGIPYAPSGTLWQDLQLLLAGIFFGLATTVRSNGLLYGLMFLYDVICLAPAILRGGQFSASLCRRMAALGLGGLVTGLGSIIPQMMAYQEYCLASPSGSKRPLWCSKAIPSIYSWVQSEYWGVGFLRYWTVSNLPLFLLAAPMLSILSASAMSALASKNKPSLLWLDKGRQQPTKAGSGVSDEMTREHHLRRLLRRLALPQLALAILAVTTYHVQIVNRISSGYVLWYWWLALSLKQNVAFRIGAREYHLAEVIIRCMVIYAIVQAALFSSFLPPA